RYQTMISGVRCLMSVSCLWCFLVICVRYILNLFCRYLSLRLNLHFVVFHIFAHNIEIAGVFQYLANSGIIICLVFPLYIYIKVVFITFAKYGHRLDFAEIDVLLRKASQYGG